MKASSLLNLILFAVIVALLFLWYRDKAQLSDLKVASAKWLKVDSLENRFESRATTWPARAEEGGTVIDTAMAGIYIRNYQQSQPQLRTSRDSTESTHSVWIDAASLGSMIKTIVEANGDGIRVYFSKYPSIKAVPDPKRFDNGAWDNRNSIVIFTTRAAANSAHEDVFYRSTLKTATSSRLDIFPSANAAPPAASASGLQGGYNYDGTCPPNKCAGAAN